MSPGLESHMACSTLKAWLHHATTARNPVAMGYQQILPNTDRLDASEKACLSAESHALQQQSTLLTSLMALSLEHTDS